MLTDDLASAVDVLLFYKCNCILILSFLFFQSTLLHFDHLKFLGAVTVHLQSDSYLK